MLAMKFGRKLETLCDQRGWNKSELARRLQVSPSTIGRWFEDERRPYDLVIVRIARILGVPLDYLADDTLDEPPAPELSEDERYLLRVFRASQLDADEASAALIRASNAKADGSAEPQASGAGRPLQIRDETEADIRRERERNRPKRVDHKPAARPEEVKKKGG